MLSATGTWDEIINYNDNNGILILEKTKLSVIEKPHLAELTLILL